MSPRDASHPYVPPGPDDSRSPCPGLNTLANHGYLPHDGRAVTFTQLVSAIHAVYGVSRPLATLFAVGGLLLRGRWSGPRRVLDLHALARHGVLEHDGSLVHDDTPPGAAFAPTEVDGAALRQLLACGSAKGEEEGKGELSLSLAELCKGQVQRQQASRPVHGFQTRLARGEVGLIYDVFGVDPSSGSGPSAGLGSPGDGLLEKSSSLDVVGAEGGGEGGGRVVPKAILEQWLGEERLPDGWEGPVGSTRICSFFALTKEIKGLEDQIRGAEGSDVADEKEVAG